MRLHDPNLKPKRLPPHAGLLERLEYGLQWLVYILRIRLENKPALSGCLSGLLTAIPLIGVLLLSFWLMRLFFHL
jgi:hypothetical protein